MNCPYCNYKFDCHKTISGREDYEDGDISFCIMCGKVGIFKEDKIVKVNEKSLPHDVQSEITRCRNAWLTMNKEY